jgi:SecD/SecF fusion protein
MLKILKSVLLSAFITGGLYYAYYELYLNRKEDKISSAIYNINNVRTDATISLETPENYPKPALQRTIKEIKQRLDDCSLKYGFISEENPVVIFIMNISDYDTTALKQLLTESANLEFRELFQVNELDLTRAQKESELKANGNLPLPAESKDSTVKNITEVIEHAERKESIQAKTILGLLHPAMPDSDSYSHNYFYSYIGTVKVKDTSLLNTLLKDPEISRHFPENAKFAYRRERDLFADAIELYALKAYPGQKAVLDGSMIEDVFADYDDNNRPVLKMSFTKQGTKMWADMTTSNTGRSIAIVINEKVVSAPKVISPVTGGLTEISSFSTRSETSYMASLLKSNPLEVPLKVKELIITVTDKSKPKPYQEILLFTLIFLISFGIIHSFRKNASKPGSPGSKTPL